MHPHTPDRETLSQLTDLDLARLLQQVKVRSEANQ